MTGDVKLRVLHVISISTPEWTLVVDKHRCPQEVMFPLIDLLENKAITKIGHNLSFDQMVMWQEGVTVRGHHDTMITHQVLHNGLLIKAPSLAELLQDQLGHYIDKTLQTSFTGEELTMRQIWYAASDVSRLHELKALQDKEAFDKKLQRVVELENAIVPAMARMEYDGIRIIPERWMEAKAWADKEFYRVRAELQQSLEDDPILLTEAINRGDIVHEDTLTINWGSHQQKKEIAEHYLSPLTGLSKPVLKRAAALSAQEGETEWVDLFTACLNEDWKPLSDYIVQTDKQWLVDRGYLRPAGHCQINWNSAPQKLHYAKLIAPRLQSVEEKALKRQTHPFLKNMIRYGEWFKRVTTYGDEFLAHIKSDGRIHTQWQQAGPETGRTASRAPNMQNIPVRGIGPIYRRCFMSEPGNVFVGSDFAGQEAVLAAFTFKEPSWLQAILRGEDLHSAVAEVVWPKEWKETAEKDCAYYQAKKKCVCTNHQILRDKVKTVNFGIIYQQTEYGLAEGLGISRTEAITLISDYYRKLPIMAKAMNRFKNFGLRNGYTMTLAPFFRKRWFRDWEDNKQFVENHISGISENFQLAEIGRQSVNTPIQGAGADMIKEALRLAYNYIDEMNLFGIVKICLLVHDELLTECPESMAEEWKELLHGFMLEAGRVIIPEGLVGADTKIKPEWSK